ncbi:MAG: MBL fold metallo-hydrolase [Phycisphaerae bacterium]
MLQPLIDLGGVSVRVISGGKLKLDGGAMFGIIPKPIWSRSCPADGENRIQLACNCLLLEWTGGRRAIVESGHGEKYAEKEQGFFEIDPARWLLQSLDEIGVEPASIDDVLLTHLHFDHAGGLTRRDGERVVATFPRAKVHVQRAEHEDARANFGIMTNTYREENYQAIDAADAWRLSDGGGEMIPGVTALPTMGHTRGHQSIVVRGRDRTLVFAGDVMPTRHHIGRPYNMGYDLFPLDNRESKNRVMKQAADEGWIVCIGHEPDAPLQTVQSDGKGWYALRGFVS